MILSDQDIKKELKNGIIEIDPLFEDAIQPSSVDLHLSNKFMAFYKTFSYLDLREPLDDKMFEIETTKEKGFELNPGEFALGMTIETVGVNESIAARMDGKSSLGRVGLFIHITAGYIDPGNELKLTLEFYNASGRIIKLYPGMPIAQVSFHKMTSDCLIPYGKVGLNSKYYKATKPQASQFYKNFNKNNSWMEFEFPSEEK